ncbi:MAG: chemotaxis-specific protein-glutamate methyltransferase CheB [Cyanobacteria bacterium J06649_4]
MSPSAVPIRVLLVEDSPVALAILKKTLEAAPGIDVVGEAKTGKEALTLIPQLDPQVICTDLHMPHMDGLALTQTVMANYPRPILVLSISVQTQNTERIFQLLEAGAVDILAKPVSGLTAADSSLNKALIEKIRILAGVRVFKKKAKVSSVSAFPQPRPTGVKRPRIIGIGASTGGPQALHVLLSQLPKDCPPVVCVQHISVGFLPGLVGWLQRDCAADITIAQAGDRPTPGRVYFAPSECHLKLDTRGRFERVENTPAVDGHRPSITVTFESLAQYYGQRVVGILLTGMGQDGATGLKKIREAGGFTIAQDEETSVVFGMPQVAIELGAARQVLPIEAITPKLTQILLNPTSANAPRQDVPDHLTTPNTLRANLLEGNL